MTEDTPQTALATAVVTIDGNRYALDSLSPEARGIIASLSFCDEGLQQRRNELAIADTARMAYSSALKRDKAAREAASDAGQPG